MRASAQVTAPGAVTSMIAAMSTRPNRQNRSTCSRMSVPLFRFQFGLRMDCCILDGSPRFVTRELEGECNQSCQQYRSDNSISPKPAPKRFLIFRIELLVLVDHLSAHRTPPAQKAEVRRGIVGVESDEMSEPLHTLNASFLECGEHAVCTEWRAVAFSAGGDGGRKSPERQAQF